MSFKTHEVFNQYDELTGYDLYGTDIALQEAVNRSAARWAQPALAAYGAGIGSAAHFAQAELANRYLPELRAFDSRGRRIDQVEFHPAWHALMAKLRGSGCIALPFDNDRPGRWMASIASMYLHNQVESGTLCPTVMTWASIPLLRREPALWAQLGDKLLSRDYDERDLPIGRKRSVYIGMGMTEKQGGSDVRSNTTAATAIAGEGRGAEYLIRGHKWFFSAPMCDAHLVVARAGDGTPSCFYVPRLRPDGSKNAVAIQRLKNKLGNRSNSGSEVEFQDAWGVLIGEEGRGIPTIIEMANYTRLSCVMSGASLIRQALVQALHYCRQRQAFGRRLADQPLMRSVLADLTIESEAALVLLTRLTQAFERPDDPAEQVWMRLVTPAAKFWVCKRSVELSGEAMEVFGGNGYVEDSPMARIFREAPVNSIWEGSGNVMCLDVLRAFARHPQSVRDLLAQAGDLAAGETAVAREAGALQQLLGRPADELESMGRVIAQRLVLVLQAALLCRHAPAAVAGAFIATRLNQPSWGAVAGALDTRGLDVQALLDRALPV